MATAPTDPFACTQLARRAVGGGNDWADGQWDAQMGDDAVLRGTPGQLYFRPYRTAMAYLLNPERVKLRTEGQVTEQFVDVAQTLAYLKEQDLEWMLMVPPAADADGDGTPDGQFDGRITFGGWD